MHMREVSAILDGVVGRHHTRSNHQDEDDVVLDAQGGTHVHHHASEGNLIEVVVQNLTQGATVVRPAGLFPVDCINRLIPKV